MGLLRREMLLGFAMHVDGVNTMSSHQQQHLW